MHIWIFGATCLLLHNNYLHLKCWNRLYAKLHLLCHMFIFLNNIQEKLSMDLISIQRQKGNKSV